MIEIKPCIISTHEAKALAAGDSLTLAVLSDGVCPALRRVDVTDLQDQFKRAVSLPCTAMAYLWRDSHAEVIRADHSPAILSQCDAMATPVRCEAVRAYADGRLSQMIIKDEIAQNVSERCDWRTSLNWQDQQWRAYFDKYADGIDKAVSVVGALELVRTFLYQSGMKFKNNSGMQDIACFQRADCNVASTRVIDLLRQVGQPVSGQVAVVEIPRRSGEDASHATLRVTIEGGSAYFNNGSEWLPGNTFQGVGHSLDPWQISSGLYGELSVTLFLGGDFVREENMIRKAREIDPYNVEVYSLIGAILCRRGDFDEGIEATKKALALHSLGTPSVVHLGLGMCFDEKGDTARAISEYQMALTYEPKLEGAHYGLAAIYELRGDIEAAISELRAELAINPKNSEASDALEDLTRWKWVYQAKTTFFSLFE